MNMTLCGPIRVKMRKRQERRPPMDLGIYQSQIENLHAALSFCGLWTVIPVINGS
jgi:hypothetical protein